MKWCKTLILCIGTICIIALNSEDVKAYTRMEERSTCSFTEDWEKRAVYWGREKDGSSRKKIGTMVYGYDTCWINEDYCWTKSDECKYQSIVTNDNGSSSSSVSEKGKSWAKEEVVHDGDSVKYAIWLSETYVRVSVSVENSNEK